MNAWVSLLLAYAMGSVSFAVIAGRLRGVDIRAYGSGNPGATNVGRVVGSLWGYLVLLGDVGKGALAVLLLPSPDALLDPGGRALLVAAVVVGHVWPVTSRFRGGKGVATLLGGCLALDPILGVICLLVHGVIRWATGFVSLASLALAWTFPLGQILALWKGDLGGDLFLEGIPVMALLALLVTLRHADNLQRMKEGREDRYDAPAQDDEIPAA
ncbi:MAG: glycerol-3-phosphate 1-O-acyltransferase PlsY [Planctomycetota bacterium]|nr:glycerol-3-phosphate 1-O-acyltransferase PlsY [Planctomycetota bacterium]